MKKIGILTINDYDNYGNRLQNYAVQEVLLKHGLNTETIIHKLDNAYLLNNEKFYKKSLIEKVNSFLMSKDKYSIIKSKLLVRERNVSPLIKERKKRFREFSKKNIIETDFSISETNIPTHLQNDFDYFVTGSDQVWNPHFRLCSAIDFLTFAPEEKRISFAASIGISEIPAPLQIKYTDYLNGLNNISVREHRAAEIVKDLTGKDAIVLIDPTLNHSKEEWLTISEPHINKPRNPYILVYFLGKLNDVYKHFIEQYAEGNNLEIVILSNSDYEKYYTADPGNFIDYINSAETFFTDSYHGIIFAILMNTPFLIFERMDGMPKMNSRMETLKQTLQLPNEAFYTLENQKPILYEKEKLNGILNYEKQKVTDFIQANMK